jgi:hypothetical protein
MASCVIRNKSIEPLALPEPLAGVLRPGQSVTIPVAASVVQSYLAPTGIPQGYEVVALAVDPATFPDAAYGGSLVSAVNALAPASGAATSASPEIGRLFSVRVPFTALVTGTADDVTIFASNAPCKFRLLDCFMNVTTLTAGATGTLFTAAAGGGTQCSSALSAAALGKIRDNITTGSQTIAAGGSLYLRRSDRAFAGEIVLICERVN